MKKKGHHNNCIIVCLLIFITCFFGCSGRKSEYQGYVPVTRIEAEAFANQLIADLKQGDKTRFFNMETDMDAIVALSYFAGKEKDLPEFLKSPGQQGRQAFAEHTVNSNHMFFDTLKSAELVEIEEILGTFNIILDCKYDQNVRRPVPNGNRHFILLKKKSSGEITVAGMTKL